MPNESAGRPGRHDDTGRIEVEIVGIPVVARDTRAQRCNPQCFSVADAAMCQRGLRRTNGGCRGRSSWLPDLHVDDMGALRLALGRRRHDIHDDERWHIAAFRRRQ